MRIKDIKVGEDYAVGTSRDHGWSQRRWQRYRVIGFKKVEGPWSWSAKVTQVSVAPVGKDDKVDGDVRNVRAQTIQKPWADHEKWCAMHDQREQERGDAIAKLKARWYAVAEKLARLGMLREESLACTYTRDGKREFTNNPLRSQSDELDSMEKLVDIALSHAAAASESAKQHRCRGDDGHAKLLDRHFCTCGEAYGKRDDKTPKCGYCKHGCK